LTISRVDLQAQTFRTQDYTALKHNEDMASSLQQSNVSNIRNKEADIKFHHVNDAENAENRQKGFDAKEEGSNGYYGDGGKNRKPHNPDGQVIVKGQQQHGFDLKI